MINESIDDAMPVDTEEVDDVVDQVLWEVTQGSMGKAPPVSNTNIINNNISTTTTTTTTTANRRVAIGAEGEEDNSDIASSLRNQLGKL